MGCRVQIVESTHLQQVVEQVVQPVADQGAVGQREESVNLREVGLERVLHGGTRWTRQPVQLQPQLAARMHRVRASML